MAKKYAFTRTLIVNRITAMACDTESAEVFNFYFNISGSIPTEKHLKKIAQEYAPENSVVVSIVNIATDRKVLGITEDAFISNAVELDPRTRRPLN